MNEKKYLSEENYQRGKKKLTTIALVVLIAGLLVGGFILFLGFMKQLDINSKYSEEAKANLQQQLEAEKQNLIAKKSELEEEVKTKTDAIQEQINELNTKLTSLKAEQSKEFHENILSEKYYSLDNEISSINKEIDELELSINDEKKVTKDIDEALNDSRYCTTLRHTNGSDTINYCSIKNQLDGLTDSNKEFDSHFTTPYFMFGGFAIFLTCMISGSIFMRTKGREIAAFTTQQRMPVDKEHITEMAPVIGKATGTIIKEARKSLNDSDNNNNNQ